MKRKLYLSLILIQMVQVIIPINTAKAYQIASNHSYVKNSEFTTDYDINIEGYGDFKAIYNKKDNDKEKKNSFTKFENEVSINVFLEGELDEVTKYGIKFIQTFNNNFKKEKEYYSYLSGFYGRLELGNTLGVAEYMRVGADTIALGSGGIASSYSRYIKLANNNLNNMNPSYILAPGVLSSQNFGYHSESIDPDFWENSKYLTKINYYTPEFYGFQLGVGVAPNVKLDPKNVGTKTIGGLPTTLGNSIDLGTFVNYGVTYINTFDTVGLALSFVGEQNFSNSLNKTNNVKEDINDEFKSMEGGINLNYFGLTFAASMGRTDRDIDKNSDANLKLLTQKKGRYMTYGVSYELDEFSFSVTHFESEYKNYTKFKSSAVALENKMSKNISSYVEYIAYESEFVAIDKKEKGYSINLGFLLNFN